MKREVLFVSVLAVTLAVAGCDSFSAKPKTTKTAKPVAKEAPAAVAETPKPVETFGELK